MVSNSVIYSTLKYGFPKWGRAFCTKSNGAAFKPDFFSEINCGLQNIYSGKLAVESPSQFLLDIAESGEIALSTYENEWFVLKSKNLSDPIKKNWQLSNYFWKIK